MQQIEKTGKTVEKALAAALEELGAERDEVDVEVVSESGRGLLGIFGQTEARIKVTRRPSAGAKAAELTEKMLSLLNIQARVNVRGEDAEGAELEIDAGEDTGLIIGRRGETLGALQYLVTLVVNRNQPQRKRILLDAGGYLERRKQALHALARRTAQQVRSSGRPVTLEALSPRERRIVHLALADDPGLTTSSTGTDPNRCVVVSPAENPPAQEDQPSESAE